MAEQGVIMQNCVGCGCLKEYEKDKFCQKCEGVHDASIYAGSVRSEVLTTAKKLDLDLQSRRMVEYTERSKQRWIKMALNLIDIKLFNIYYQSFMRKFTQLTEHISPLLPQKPNSVSPAQYEDHY
jgi:hypothetical protein